MKSRVDKPQKLERELAEKGKHKGEKEVWQKYLAQKHSKMWKFRFFSPIFGVMLRETRAFLASKKVKNNYMPFNYGLKI